MIVIDRETVKTNLGITDSSQDAAIDAQIPIIDAKVKQICQNNFNNQISLDATSGVVYAEVQAVWQWTDGYHTRYSRPNPMLSEIIKDIPVGTYVEGEGIARTYVAEVFYDTSAEFSGVTYAAPFIELATAPTATNTDAQVFYGWNKAYDSVVSKGIWWLIGETSTKITDGSWKTRKYGPISVTKGGTADEKIDLKSGMPLWFVKALPRYHR